MHENQLRSAASRLDSGGGSYRRAYPASPPVRFSFQARYEVLHDVETLGLSEDYRLGPTAVAQVRWSDPAFFSPQRYLEAGLSLRYRVDLGGNLVTASAAGSARLMQGDPGCGVAGPWVNRRFAAQLYEVSPVLGFGRFVARALVDLRAAPLSRQLLVLGGSNGLRGAEAEQYVGSNLALVNLEYRTLPVELLTLHVGLVLFLDAGAAFPESPWVRSVGLGLRFLFPQFDRETVRIDFGYVFDEPGGPRPLYRYFSASFGQVTDFQPGYLGSPLD